MLQAPLTGVRSGAPGHLMATVVSNVVQARSVSHRHHYGTTRKTPSSESAAPASIPIRLRHFLTSSASYSVSYFFQEYWDVDTYKQGSQPHHVVCCCRVSFGGHKEALLACVNSSDSGEANTAAPLPNSQGIN